jgi:DNA processing protein
MPTLRELLIAWNAHPRLSRAAICRLGRLAEEAGGELPGLGGRGEQALRGGGGQQDDGEAPAAVPAAQLARALRARGAAARDAAREEARARRLGARLVTLADDDYPPPLRELALPPPVLAVRGELPAQPAVALVGSRHPDAYGLAVASLFAHALASAGVTVVSGFARGIDAAAHRAAISAGGAGRTIAVLGCGLGVAYPRGHGRLGEEITARGALVSEFPCGLPPLPRHFPIRNRVIAALARATLVVQATLRSGSLSTAYHALDLGREVYAVPGPIFDELAAGTNALIHDGAALARHPDDLLEPLGLGGGGAAPRALLEVDAPAASGSSGGDPVEHVPPGFAGEVLHAFGARAAGSAATVEQIAGRLGTTVDRVLAALLDLELAAWIERLPGGLFRRSRHPP